MDEKTHTGRSKDRLRDSQSFQFEKLERQFLFFFFSEYLVKKEDPAGCFSVSLIQHVFTTTSDSRVFIDKKKNIDLIKTYIWWLQSGWCPQDQNSAMCGLSGWVLIARLWDLGSS